MNEPNVIQPAFREGARPGESPRDLPALCQLLLDQLPVGVFHKDREGRYVFVNAWFCRLQGAAKDEYPGQNRQEVTAGRWARNVAGQTDRLRKTTLLNEGANHHALIMETGKPVETEEHYTDGAGREWHFHAIKGPLFGSDGAIIGSQGILLDVTERKRAEAQLANERDFLQALLNSSPDAIYFKDRKSRFLRCSAAMAPLFNLKSPDELVGKSDFDFQGADHAEKAFQDEQEIMRSGQPVVGKAEKEAWPDGRVTWALTSKMPFYNGHGEIIGTFGISKNITAIKEAEAKVEQLHKQLLQTSREAGMAEVATSVLHNVGNVLNSVNVSASLLLESAKKSKVPSLAKAVALLREHAGDVGAFLTADPKGRQFPGYLSLLSEELSNEQKRTLAELDLIRREHRTRQGDCGDAAELRQAVGFGGNGQGGRHRRRRAADERGRATRHGVALVRDYSDDVVMSVDKHKVLQVLVNLIRNAKYACDESERKDKQIKLQIAKEDQWVNIAVIDNGVGIPPENLTRIFNHGFTTRKDGHGFGLHSGALAAKELGGSLTVCSGGWGLGDFYPESTLPASVRQQGQDCSSAGKGSRRIDAHGVSGASRSPPLARIFHTSARHLPGRLRDRTPAPRERRPALHFVRCLRRVRNIRAGSGARARMRRSQTAATAELLSPPVQRAQVGAGAIIGAFPIRRAKGIPRRRSKNGLLRHVVHAHGNAQHRRQADQVRAAMAVAHHAMVGPPMVHHRINVPERPRPGGARREPRRRPGRIGALVQNLMRPRRQLQRLPLRELQGRPQPFHQVQPANCHRHPPARPVARGPAAPRKILRDGGMPRRRCQTFLYFRRADFPKRFQRGPAAAGLFPGAVEGGRPGVDQVQKAFRRRARRRAPRHPFHRGRTPKRPHVGENLRRIREQAAEQHAGSVQGVVLRGHKVRRARPVPVEGRVEHRLQKIAVGQMIGPLALALETGGDGVMPERLLAPALRGQLRIARHQIARHQRHLHRNLPFPVQLRARAARLGSIVILPLPAIFLHPFHRLLEFRPVVNAPFHAPDEFAHVHRLHPHPQIILEKGGVHHRAGNAHGNASHPQVRLAPHHRHRQPGAAESQNLLPHVLRDGLVFRVLHVPPVNSEGRQPLLRVPRQHRRQINRPRPFRAVEPPDRRRAAVASMSIVSLP